MKGFRNLYWLLINLYKLKLLHDISLDINLIVYVPVRKIISVTFNLYSVLLVIIMLKDT